MKIHKTLLVEILIVELRVIEDERGYFFESFNTNDFRSLGLTPEFVQDNCSHSKQGVLTKGTFFVYFPPFIAWYLLHRIWKAGFASTIKQGIVVS